MVNFTKEGNDRQIGQEVVRMKINPRMDLVALVLANHDIVLHRLLSWQRAWGVPKPKNLKPLDGPDRNAQRSGNIAAGTKQNVMVIDIEWSPCGHVLAVAYAGIFGSEASTYPLNIVDPLGTQACTESYRSSIALYAIDSNKLVSYINVRHTLTCSLFWRAQQDFDLVSGQFASNQAPRLSSLPLDTFEPPYVDLFADEDSFQTALQAGKWSDTSNAAMLLTAGRKKIANCKGKAAGYLGRTFPVLEDYDRVALYGNHLGRNNLAAFNILVTGSLEGVVDVYAFGAMKLLTIDVNHLLNRPVQSTACSEWLVQKVWISYDLSCLSLVVQERNSSVDAGLQANDHRNDAKPESDLRQLVTLPSDLLASKWREIYAFMRIKAQLDVRLEFAADILSEMGTIWEDLVAELDSKLSNYIANDEEQQQQQKSQLDGFGVSASAYQPRTKKISIEPQEFMEMLVFGEVTLNLERFLTDLSERGLRKLSTSIESSFMLIHEANVSKLQRALFHILSYLQVLKGMALHDVQFGDLYLSVGAINTLVRETLAFLRKSIRLQQNLNDSSRKTRAFIRWLHKCLHMVGYVGADAAMLLGTEQADSGGNPSATSAATSSAAAAAASAFSATVSTSSPLTDQDLNLIMNFLRENSLTHGFKFESVSNLLQRKKQQLAATLFCAQSAAELPVAAGTRSRRKVRSNSTCSLSTRTKSAHSKGRTNHSKMQNAASKSKKQDTHLVNETKAEVPHKLFAYKKRLKRFLEMLSSFNKAPLEANSLEKLLERFFGNLERPDLHMDELDSVLQESNSQNEKVQWGSDFWNDADDIEQLHDDVFEPLSLSDHLFRLYDRFVHLFDTCSGQKINHSFMRDIMQANIKKVDLQERDHCCDESKLTSQMQHQVTSPLVAEPEKLKIDYLSGCVSHDYLLLNNLPSRARLSLLRLTRPLTYLHSMVEGSSQCVQITFLLKQPVVAADNRTLSSVLTIEDAKFYDQNLLTLLLSSKALGESAEQCDKLEGNANMSSCTLDLSVPDEEMFSENEQDCDQQHPVSSAHDNFTSTGSPSIASISAPLSNAYFLVQFAYKELFRKLMPSTFTKSSGETNDCSATLIDLSYHSLEIDLSNNCKLVMPQSANVDCSYRTRETVSELHHYHSADDAPSCDNEQDFASLFTIRLLDDSLAVQLAVSGNRKVACVVSTPKSMIQVYTMDANEEAEEEEPPADHQCDDAEKQ